MMFSDLMSREKSARNFIHFNKCRECVKAFFFCMYIENNLYHLFTASITVVFSL